MFNTMCRRSCSLESLPVSRLTLAAIACVALVATGPVWALGDASSPADSLQTETEVLGGIEPDGAKLQESFQQETTTANAAAGLALASGFRG